MTPLKTVHAFAEAWARHDLDAAISMLTDDFVFEASGPAPDGIRHVGSAAAARAWQDIFDSPASRFTPEETIVAGDRIVQRWRYDWGEGHVRGVDLFVVRDGRIAEKLSYVKG